MSSKHIIAFLSPISINHYLFISIVPFVYHYVIFNSFVGIMVRSDSPMLVDQFGTPHTRKKKTGHLSCPVGFLDALGDTCSIKLWWRQIFTDISFPYGASAFLSMGLNKLTHLLHLTFCIAQKHISYPLLSFFFWKHTYLLQCPKKIAKRARGTQFLTDHWLSKIRANRETSIVVKLTL